MSKSKVLERFPVTFEPGMLGFRFRVPVDGKSTLDGFQIGLLLNFCLSEEQF